MRFARKFQTENLFLYKQVLSVVIIRVDVEDFKVIRLGL